MARDQVFLRVLRFLPVSVIPPLLNTHIGYQRALDIKILLHCFVHFSLLTVGVHELCTLPTLCP